MAEFDPLRDVARHTIPGTAVNPFTHPQAASPLQRLPLHEVRIATFAFDKATMPSRRLGLTDRIQLMSTWMARA